MTLIRREMVTMRSVHEKINDGQFINRISLAKIKQNYDRLIKIKGYEIERRGL